MTASEMPQKSPQILPGPTTVADYDRIFLVLAASLAALFERTGDKMLQSAIAHTGWRHSLLHIYRSFHRVGVLTEIERLPAGEKGSLWAQAKELGVDPGNKAEAMDACRALHALAVAVELNRAGQFKNYYK